MPGLGLLKVFMMLVALGLFVYPWWTFLRATWNAPATPVLDDGLVHLANLVAGVLSSAFAIALGVKVEGGSALRESLSPGDVLTWSGVPDWTRVLMSASVWIYFLVGVGALFVYLRNRSVSPGPVRDFALVFAGYAAAYLAVAIGTSAT